MGLGDEMNSYSRRLSIVIPNYDRKEDLKRLLPSIANQTFEDYKVIIIDDCSPDKSVVEYIKSFIRDRNNMCLVENVENIGFVRTCNRGIKLANSEYICILTNDTEVAQNFIQRNVEIMDADKSIGVLSCIIMNKDGNIWFSGGSLKGWIPAMLTDDFQGVRLVDYVAGTAPFYRREVFDKVGFLNEDFFMYHEDVEFCLRVRHETDYRTCMFGDKLVIHNVGSHDFLPYRANYYIHRNLILILKKYSSKSIPKLMLRYLREIANLILVSVLKLNTRYLCYTPHIIRGTLDGLIEKQSL